METQCAIAGGSQGNMAVCSYHWVALRAGSKRVAGRQVQSGEIYTGRLQVSALLTRPFRRRLAACDGGLQCGREPRRRRNRPLRICGLLGDPSPWFPASGNKELRTYHSVDHNHKQEQAALWI